MTTDVTLTFYEIDVLIEFDCIEINTHNQDNTDNRQSNYN